MTSLSSASASKSSTSACPPATIEAHVPHGQPEGGAAGIELGDEPEQFAPGARLGRVAGEAVGDGVEPAEGPVRRPVVGRVVVGSQVAALDRVEEVVDHLLGVGGDEDAGTVPPVRDLGVDERRAEQVEIAGRPLVEKELGGGLVVDEHDRERADLLLDLREQSVGRGLGGLGDDQLLAVPPVRDAGLDERLGQLGTLVDRPAGEVVVDLHHVGVGRVEVVGQERTPDPFGPMDR
jgi:hypothetical protein